MAKLIAIEGIDGAGKGTQAKLLVERLREVGHTAELIGFPRYQETLFGQAVAKFLNGGFGPLDQVDPFLAASLYAGDRFESLPVVKAATEVNDYIIFDRYYGSNLAHQGARVPEDERAEFIERVKQLEFEVYGIPKPDLTILLDLPADLARKQVEKKAKRDYTELTVDLQEENLEYQIKVRECYRELAEIEDSWVAIACNDTLSEVRPIHEIAGEIQHQRIG
ncbi:dTMP kinase [Stratiformator vulcanicus]|uniref:Thymidylate kinase n=1 Tax=Stratiformator vulcanicus TaxID=2527980 RepID=A0A517R3N6_9PLAN|nr:dTMP kinase [Stratiformator vulcanicus]QDT38508.1 Thymidylate kinase [Stratiformator vulcanicus]